MSRPRNIASFKQKIIEILDTSCWDLTDARYNGDGGPGRLLEDLLSAMAGNADTPDLDGWEIKFHRGGSLLTLFHKEALPVGSLVAIVEQFGWPGKSGENLNFRHTICAKTGRGFYIAREPDRVVVRHKDDTSVELYWYYNTLLNAMISKCRRLVVVTGSVRSVDGKRCVGFDSARFFWEPLIDKFVEALDEGKVCIDFDARTTRGRGTALRNHGTKFRINPDELHSIYAENETILRDNLA